MKPFEPCDKMGYVKFLQYVFIFDVKRMFSYQETSILP